MRGLKNDRTARVLISVCVHPEPAARHYGLGLESRHRLLRCAAAFDEIATLI